ncbi:MAG TPA: hypothetical protein VGF94_16885 [Kofleriaceae bacterium]|jgi:hypothetical protein
MKPTHAVILVFALAGCPPHPTNNGPDGGGGSDAPAACSAQPGFETVEALGASGAPGGYSDVSLELSQYDEPMLAYDGLSGGDNTGSQLYFTMWDRASCTWRAPVSIDTVGNVPTDNQANDGFPREVKLVQDGVSQHLAIVYQKQRVEDDVIYQDVMLAQSSDLGTSWRTEVVAQPQSSDASDNIDQPTVAFSANEMYVAYYQSYSPDPEQRCSDTLCNVIHLRSRDGETGAFDDLVLPPADGNVTDDDTVGPEISIGIDLQPSVVFAEVTSADPGPGVYIAYYYGGTTHVAFSTNGRLNVVTGLDIVVDGETPYVAATAARTLTDDSNDVFFAAGSAIAGTSWSTPAAMPPNGSNYQSAYVSIAQDDATHAISIASDFYGGSDGPAQCGGPNLSTSADSGAHWSTCGADPTGAFSFAGDFVTVKYARTGKRIAAYNYTTQGTSLGDGLVVWRE